jgi:hypothetical protein
MEHLGSRCWRKSSYSGNGGADCVEVGAHADDGCVLVRDTRDRQGPVLTFSPQDWRRFADHVKKLADTSVLPRQRAGGLRALAGAAHWRSWTGETLAR